MMSVWRQSAAVTIGVLFAAGCSARQHVEPVATSGPAVLDCSGYEVILHKYVDKGLVRYRSLTANPGLLDRFVDSVAGVGPTRTPGLFPTRQHELAFWINVHNAAALQAAVRAYPTKSVWPVWQDFSQAVTVAVDGRRMTLRRIADQARAAGDQDPRIELALALPAKGSPELAGEVYSADRMETQLAQAVRRALENPNLVKIDHEHWVLRLGPAVYRSQARFVEVYGNRFHTEHGTIINALGLWADDTQRRRLNTALGYPVRELEFDGTLNEKDEPSCALD